MRLHRPIGIWLLMWPMLWALWIAGAGHPDERLLAVFLLGALLMRSAGCVINDYADRDLDPFVERTKDRPLAARRVSPNEALLHGKKRRAPRRPPPTQISRAARFFHQQVRSIAAPRRDLMRASSVAKERT